MKRFSKLKKAAAAILGAALMLTSLSVPAFATETDAPVIDLSKKGSITINKYEGEKDDTSKPLEGVEFTIYKIADLQQTTTGNSTEFKMVPTVAGIDEINSTTTYESIKSVIENAIENGELLAADTGTTQLNETTKTASVTFNNLDLGVYLVEETDAPPQVVNRSANFLVSVPMMNTEGTGWNYDIEANPKNQAVYGGITLIKKGTDDALLQGVTFTLQRKNNDKWEGKTEYKTDSYGSLNVPNLAPGTYRFIETDLGDNPGYILDGKTAYEFTVNADGKILIGDGSQATDNGVINVVNEKPDMTKQVQNRKDKWGQDADYNVGDKVPYKITVDVPKNITGLEMFTITDTPKNLKDDINSVKVKCDDNEINNTDNQIYTVTQNSDENGFTIQFHPTAMSDYAGKKLTIEYQAKLLEDADTTTEGNPNTAKLEYSNMIKPDQEDTNNPNNNKEPGKNTIEDNAVVYTFKINVHKQDEKKNPLQGVTFDLYKEVTPGTLGAEQGTAANGLSKDKYWLKLNANSLITDEKGDISVSGLANGDYYLVETKTASGYNLLKEPVKVTLSILYKTSMTKTWEWADDGTNNGKKLVKHTITSAETTFAGGDTTSANAGFVTQTVINKKGFTLPATGGMGTVLFGVGGAALALAGLYMILSSRKKTSK